MLYLKKYTEMENKKYRLKKHWPGLPKGLSVGDIFTLGHIGDYKTYYECKVHCQTIRFSTENVESEEWAEYWEPIIECTPIGKTSESEVYLNGVDSNIYPNNELWTVRLSKYNIFMCQIDGFYPLLMKHFLTRQAAEDYVKLQKAIKKAVWLNKSTVKRYFINKYGIPCASIGTYNQNLSWFEKISIAPYDCELYQLNETIELLTKIKEEREGE